MAGRSLAVPRARARLRLIAAIAVTVLVLVLALSFAVGWLTAAVRTAVVDTVAAAAPNDAQTVLQIPVAGDPAAQAAKADAFLHDTFGDALLIAAEPASEGGTSRWTLRVDPDRFTPGLVAVIAADLDDLAVLAKDVPGLAPEGASTEGGLADTLDGASANVLAIGAVVPVPLALTAIGGLIAVLQLARLLGRSRAAETALLRARGLDSRTARRMALLESGVTVGAACLVGWAAAVAIVVVTGDELTAALAATWPVPVASFVVLGVLAANGQLRAAGDSGTGRARAAVTGFSTVLVVLAAAFFLWQLSGLAGDAAELTGNAWSLVVLAVAPALGLAAIASLALLLFGPVSALVARLAAQRRTLSPALPARMTARHVTAFGVVVALLALGSGGATFAGVALSTWGRAADDTALLLAGADVRATPGSGSVGAGTVAEAAAASGVVAAAGVLTDAATAGGAELDVVAVPPASAGALFTAVPGAGVDPARLARAIGGDAPVGAELGDASGVRMTFSVTAAGGTRPDVPDPSVLGGEAWFVDGLGTPARATLELTLVRDPSTRIVEPFFPGDPQGPIVERWTAGTLTASAEVPAGSGDWMLVGFTFGFTGTVGSQAPSLQPEEIATADGSPLTWPSTAPVVLQDGQPSATFVFATAPGAVPAAVTSALAGELGLGTGDTFEVVLDRSRRTVPVRIAEIVRAIPGTRAAEAVLMPLAPATLTMVSLSGTAALPDELWASGDGARAAVAAALPDAAVRVAADTGSFTRALVVPWWIAVVATGVLAGIALIAAALGLAQQRGTDVFVLRALGTTARRQSSSRAAELVVVSVGALLAGALLGAPLALVAAPVLTQAAVAGVPAALSGVVVLGAAPLAVVCGLAALAVVAASVAVSRIIARQAVAGRVREVA